MSNDILKLKVECTMKLVSDKLNKIYTIRCDESTLRKLNNANLIACLLKAIEFKGK